MQLFGMPRVVLHDRDAHFTAQLLALFVGIIGFLGCIIVVLPSTDRWADRMYSLDSGIGYLLCFGLVWVP